MSSVTSKLKTQKKSGALFKKHDLILVLENKIENGYGSGILNRAVANILITGNIGPL